MFPKVHLKRLAAILLLVVLPIKGMAQWLTQTNNLVTGWNSVYLNVDAGFDTIDHMVGGDPSNPIQEIWMWNPAPGSAQYFTDPSSPFSAGTQWVQWLRSSVNITPNALNILQGNKAFLVRTTNNYAWKVKGKAVPPSYQWNSSGENFIGFPANPSVPPTFDQYLSPVPPFESTAQIFRYVGGNLGPGNPAQVGAFPSTSLVRGQAYWVRSANFNNYYAPFTVNALSAGLSFGATRGQSKITLANNTSHAITVYLNLVNSEAAPTGQPPVVATPPILVRGNLNTTNLTYGYSVLNNHANTPVTLQPAGTPGDSMDVVLGLNRYAIANANPGDLVAAILRLTDATGLAQIDLPVSATVANNTGLWVGKASVNAVNQYLNTYYTAKNLVDMTNVLNSLNIVNGANGVNYQIDTASGRIIGLTTTNGVFLASSSTVTNAGVPKAFELRLIMHMGMNEALGISRATLLQHVYVGKDVNGNQIVATTTNLLDPAQLDSARRMSAVQLPWQGDGSNSGWISAEPASASPSTYTFTVPLDYNDAGSNPFVHSYHPDHNNLDDHFAPLPAGQESFNINRTIRLFFAPPGTDFVSITGSSGHLQGNYSETISITDGVVKERDFDVSGAFTLNQIVDSDTVHYLSTGAGAQTLRFSQGISFGALPNVPYSPIPIVLNATSSSGLPVVYTVTGGPATVSSNLLTMTGLGLVSVTATQPGGGNIGAAPPVRQSFTISLGLNAITFNTVAVTNYITGTIPLSATASSGLPVSFSLVSGPATLSGNSLSITGVGNVLVAARQAGNALYQTATPVTNTIVVGRADQTISFAQLPNISYTTGTIALSATASSTLPVTFSVASGPATVSGNTMSITGVGTVAIIARQVGNANYNSAPPITNSFTVGQSTETITFAALPNISYTTTPITLSATCSSGLAVTFAVASGPATISGNNLTITGVGNVSVTASQAGSANYVAATPVSRTFTVGKATQTITFAGIPNGTYLGAPVTLQGTSSSGLPVTFTIGSGPATISGNTLTYTGGGNVTVLANQAGNANYLPATQVSQSFSIAQAAQTITFTAIPNGTYLGPTVTLQATASSSLPVTFSVASGPATISGNTLTYTGAGAVSVVANQAGNGNYLAAPAVSRGFTVAQAAQTITFAAIPNGTYLGAPVTLSPTSSSGLPVTLSIASGPATLSGNTLTYTGAGAVSVVASQAGNGNYLAAANVTQNFTVAQASQTITFNQPSDTSYSTTPIGLTASASSGLGVSFAVTSGPAAVSGNNLTLTGVGTVTVTATQAGNGNYLAAAPVVRSFAVSKASQAINFAAVPDTAFGSGTINLSASATATGPVSFSVVSGPAQIMGSQLSMTGVGVVTVAANQSGDGNYLAAPQVTRTFNVTKGTQSISFSTPANTTWPVSGTIALNAVASSGGTVSFSVASGPATVSGSVVTVTGAGTISITANQSGTANYNAAASVTVSFVVNQGAQTISFSKPADTTYPVNSAIALSASASSGGPVTFTVASGPATVSGSSLTVTGAGVITVNANQVGTANFQAAPQVSQSFTVNKAAQTINFSAIPTTSYPNAVNLAATATSGGAVIFSVISGPATISGATLTPTGVGAVTVAANQAGNANYLAAPQVTGNGTINKGSQTITFNNPGNGHYSRSGGNFFSNYNYNYSIALNATASSGLPVAFTLNNASSGSSIGGNILSSSFSSSFFSPFSGTINYQVTAQQSGSANYNAATSVTQSWLVSYP